MPVSEARLRQLLNVEEPDYHAVAAEVGGEAFDALSILAEDADASVAARAASLAAVLATDNALTAAAVEALNAAALHPDPGPRAAAALGDAIAGADALTAQLIADPNAGVRLIAMRVLTPPLAPAVADAVNDAAKNDPEPAVQSAAVGLSVRNPDPTLGNELLACVIEFAFNRLAELRALALGDVSSFALAVGVPGFVDPGGVAGLLASATSALDLIPPKLVASDFAGAATQLALALKAISDAAIMVGGLELPALLSSQISWHAVAPRGLAKQLGLPNTAPALSVRGATLVATLSAKARVLTQLPVKLGFDRADLSARIAMDATGPTLSVSLEIFGLEAGVADGPIANLFGGKSGSFSSDIVIGVDSTTGLTIGGGGGSRVVVPARPALGPLDIREIAIELPPGVANTFDIGASISTAIGEVIAAAVEGAGIHLHIDPAGIGGGASPLSVSVKPPTGIGLAVDTGLVRGGGYLSSRPEGFGGALQLRLGPVEVKAVGLLTLDPHFALVVVMSIEFLPPLDLTFGFTLNAVGGVVGIEHRLDTDALRESISSGALDHIMFPADPVAAAPTILSTLEHVFPPARAAVVIGPMVEIGWGRPVSFLTAQLGVILSLPDPRVVIIGRARIALPAPQLPIIDLRAVVYGEITPDHLLILVSLNGSRIAGFAVGGDIGLLLRWVGSPEIAIAAGGFHPRYQPPRELTGMQRLHMNLSPPAILSMRAEAYFALTSNTVQLGSRVEISADLGVADISGHFGFDALILFSPRFAFTLDAVAGLTVHVFGETVAGVQLLLHLSGPAPWYAQGHAEIEVLMTSVDIDVGPITWGERENPPPALADPRQLVHDAIHHNPGAWQALSPPDADRVVRLKAAAKSDTEITVHPMGMFDVRQHAVPLETTITHVGANPVPEDGSRVNFGVPVVNSTPAGAVSAVTDLFSAATYLDLTEDQKLSRPSFEPMPAGARLRPPGERADFDSARQAELRYETFVCDDAALRGVKLIGADKLIANGQSIALAAGAAGRSDLRAATRYFSAPDPISLADPGEVRVVSKATVAAADPAAWATYTHLAEQPLEENMQLARLGVA